MSHVETASFPGNCKNQPVKWCVTNLEGASIKEVGGMLECLRSLSFISAKNILKWFVFFSPQSSVRTCLNRFLPKSILMDICFVCSKTNRHLNWNNWTRFLSVDTKGRLRMRCYTLKTTTVDIIKCMGHPKNYIK